MAQPFLHADEHRLVVARLDMNDPVGEKPGLLESRREQIRMYDAPEHRAGQTGGDSGRETGCDRAVERAMAAPGDLVQAAERKPPAR